MDTNGLTNGSRNHDNSMHKNQGDLHSNGWTNGTTNGAHTVPQVAQDNKQVPIAICGMGMRLPGGIHNDKALYDFLINKGDARSVIGPDRYNIDGYYDPHGKIGTINTKYGYFINGVDLSKFDVSMFTLTPAEAEQVDPNHRLVLEVVREAFESAGEVEWRGKNIGTYVGMFSEDWQDLQHKDTHEYNPYRVLGGFDFALPNRVSYEYDLKGPSMIIKTACSSAGLCLHQALLAIRQGDISSAIVCGSNLIIAPGTSVSMTAQRVLSPDGSSKSFDASADGYARGEGVTALYIKRLDKAIEDKNPIRAIIRSSATNADGRTNGMVMPNIEAHKAVIRRAYDTAGLDPLETAMVEAHGTGTKAGDPLEAKAIAACFGSQDLYLGAIKPNFGHSEGAAAITSIFKAVLSLENRTIIPNIKFKTPNPAIPWKSAGLVVPVESCPWPEDRAERISVNSYGIGGSNVHFIIDSATSFGVKTPSNTLSPSNQRRKNLLLFSANHAESLKKVAQNIEAYFREYPDRLGDLAFTLARRREHLKLRSYCVVKDDATPFEVSSQTKFQGPRQAAFVFTGQGAQWVRMGKGLMLYYPSVLDDIRAMDKDLQGLVHAPSWSIEDILMKTDDKTIIGRAELAQPICTALQIALVNLLATWGVTPAAVVGHSSGEIAASYAAGALTSKDAIMAAYYRGYVCKTPRRSGGMAAIGLGKEVLRAYLVQGVRIACENSASNVTLSGDLNVLESVMSKINEQHPDVLVRKLQVEMAYHSHHMTQVGDLYFNLMDKYLCPNPPKIPFYSSVKAKVLHEASDFGPRYWQENLESPVLFHTAVRALLSGYSECSVHVEVGPHAALSGPLRQIYSETSTIVNYVSTLIRGRDDVDSFLEAMGQLYTIGVRISYPSVSENARVLPDLPSYPWHHEKSYWSETRVMQNWRFRQHPPHDLLGLRTLEGSEIAPTWRNELRLTDVPWLRDHCVGNDIVFPGAGYIAMAGEAIFQIDDVRDFTIREMELTKAMVLYNDKQIELLTSLRPRRLTSTLDSDWYEFQIISYDGVAWSKHCFGFVRSGRASTDLPKKTEALERQVSSSRWYETMARVGLNYGPRFTGLENITASVLEKVAAAEVVDKQDTAESSYMLHPSTLDLIFQCLTVATCQGIYRNLKTLFLPTILGELYVGNAAEKAIRVNAVAAGKPGSLQGDSYGVAEDEIVFYLKDFRGKAIEDLGVEKPHGLRTLQLQWKPHYEFLHAGDLMQLKNDIRGQIRDLETLYVLCAVETRNALSGVFTSQPHLGKYRTWLDEEHKRFQQPGYPLVEESRKFVSMEKDERRKLIPAMVKKCQDSGSWGPATAMWRAYDQATNVFEGRTDYLDLLLEDGLLTQFYSWYNEIWEFQNLMQILGHTQPQMRILEIGAGTGGLTAKFLEQLKSDFGERLYLKYTFTDISSGFFVQAKERFKENEGMEYKALDISKNPLEQGFAAGEYDLVIASNVLHATPLLHDTLTNVRTLLQPKGQLFMQELCPTTRAMNFIMGLFSGWWLSEEDGRIGSPLIPPGEWDERLRIAGFAGCDSVTVDYEEPYTYSANIIAKPAVEYPSPRKVTLLRGPHISSLILDVENLLLAQGVQVEHCEWGKGCPADQDLISFLDLEGPPLLQNINEEDLAEFLRMVDDLQQSIVLWLTPSAQIHPADPYAAQMLGLARTIRSEMAMSFATLELENTGTGAADAVVNVVGKLQRSNDEVAELDPDTEYVWVNGSLNVSRFHWVPVDKALSETTLTAKSSETKSLEITSPGLLQTLGWSSQPIDEPAPDEVIIRAAAVGLNFKDVMIAMGIISSGDTLKKGTNLFGLEGVGYVTKVGSEVTNVAVGDRVIAVGSESVGMATVIQRSADLCIRIPDQLSDEEAATMAVVYVTVLMFLVEKWKLEKGQSILIHSAAGGVGICAINVAKWIGAEIYATVGTEEKASFLTREFGIPHERIFSSRDSTFLNGVMTATDGAGVDLVLNSLSGEPLHDSWKCVASSGAMVDIGKRDMLGRGQLALAPFEDNRTFIGAEISRLFVTHKLTVERLLNFMLKQYLEGKFKPITPITSFDAEHVTEAFRFMQKGSHIGKLIIKFPKEDTLPLTPTVPVPHFRADVSYLLAGGLGGLGKAVASWMVSYGARNLIFLTRSGGKSREDQAFFRELNVMGASTQCFPCDVGDRVAVKNAIAQATLPIAGVMQMAMVLRDVGVLGMDLDSWNGAVRPKIEGAWNLHDLLPKDMEFFVLFSSVCGTFGNYGQSNYASANTFLDSFCQYRQDMGLAASIVNIGPVDDVGFVARTPAARDAMLATLDSLLTEQDFLDTLQLAIARSSTRYAPQKSGSRLSGYQNPSHIVSALESRLPIMDPQNGNLWRRDLRMAIYRIIQKTSVVGVTEVADHLKQFLSSLRSNPTKLDLKSTVETIAREVANCVSTFLMKGDEAIDLSSTLTAIGVDSLVAIEVRNWWKQNLGVDVSVLELVSGGTIEQLGELAVKRLRDKYSGK